MALPARVQQDLRRLAMKYHVRRIVLFGSRARGTNRPKSDIDLAVWGCSDFGEFSCAVEEEVWTLLKFDLVDMDQPYISDELRENIRREGVEIYAEMG